jgi:hypothetical protein
MSRYTVSERDLICTVGMDYACQFWATDHRGEPLPMTIPCKLSVVDALGQQLFETEAENPDPLADAVLTAAPENGVLQLTIPRAMSADWFPGSLTYDVWATIIDDEAATYFPNGQQMPISKGRFIIVRRTTELED